MKVERIFRKKKKHVPKWNVYPAIHLNQPEVNETKRFSNNKVRTTKYTFYNFIPKNLFEQFRRATNVSNQINPNDTISYLSIVLDPIIEPNDDVYLSLYLYIYIFIRIHLLLSSVLFSVDRYYHFGSPSESSHSSNFNFAIGICITCECCQRSL